MNMVQGKETQADKKLDASLLDGILRKGTPFPPSSSQEADEGFFHETMVVNGVSFLVPSGDGRTFTTFLLHLIDVSGKRDSEVYKKAGVSRQLFSKIRSDDFYRPKKETVLSLCLALEIGVAYSKLLLSLAGYSLSSAYPMDLIVLFCLENGLYDPELVNGLLAYKNLPPLLAKKDGE